MNRLYEAYWISPDGTIYPVPVHHINVISENKKLFGITDEYYYSMFDKFKEPYGFEGYARAILMLEAFKQGWIRIRLGHNQGWKIESWNFGLKEKSYLEEWFSQIYKLKGNKYLWSKVRIAVHNDSNFEAANRHDPVYLLDMNFSISDLVSDRFILKEINENIKHN